MVETDSVPKRNLEFLELVGQLKHLKRKGWVLEKVPDPESIASHMYRMAIMSFLIEPSCGIDRLRCMELAVIHDLAECIVGDITPHCGISADEKRKKEQAAMEQITRLMPTNGLYMRQLFDEYENQTSSEAKLVKEFDRLDMIIQAFEYEKQDGSANVGRLEDFFVSTEGKFATPFIKSIVDELNCSSTTSVGSQKELMSKHLPKRKPILGVKKIIMIASGKGGVGKSTVAVNLAVALKTILPQKDVGLLDADVFGPSIPLMMNVNDTPLITDDDRMKPLMNYGVKFMSMGSLITETSAAIWRGLMVMNALNKLIRQVAWEPLDYMIIDTPPGTGDTHLSLHQNIPIAGAIVVSTGQKAALQVTRRGITMFEKLQIPVIGLIHNMSHIRCTKCSNQISMFGDHFSEFSKSINVEIIGEVPFDSTVSSGCDDGIPIVISHPSSMQAQAFLNAASKIADFLPTE
ncbi:hypothetical protein V9T40_012521 [Parthenolecanium corni]|uniref:5'-deoxynucleotidase HDDC2 n=1 Tax=Parthenolecanium corni TaxID=536013 RepID=A0AAN9T9P2_9HEMI